MPVQRRWRFGAELFDGGVHFRLWAPRARSAAVLVEGKPLEIPMQPAEAGWFEAILAGGKAGLRYRYRVDEHIVPDPASRHQPEGVHGPSEIVDPQAYVWNDSDWRGRRWEEIVLYELHVGTFSATGTFEGVARHLDHLCALGVTAIELMPVADFAGSRNWGYDGVLLYAPTRCYGRPEALKALVDACHRREIAIFLDVVYNHFGPEGNYLHLTAPDYFTERHHTPWGAAIGYDGKWGRVVRDFVIENAIYWLDEFHFDGLRLDAVHAIIDESEPDILSEIAVTVRKRLPGRETHLILENDRNEASRLRRAGGRPALYTAQWNDDLHHALHVLLTGEEAGYYMDFADQPTERLGRALAEGFAYQGEPSRYRGDRPRGEPSGTLPATAFVAYLQNHDQVGNNAFGLRLSSRASEAALHAALSIVLLSPQIPLLFMGEEWGTARPFLFFCDFEPILAAAVTEGRRREFARFPEFTDPAARSRIPDPAAPEAFASSKLDWSEISQPEHARWLARYRRLLALRHGEIVPRLSGMPAAAGQYRILAPRALSVEWRLGEGSRLRLFVNFGRDAVPLEAGSIAGRLLYATAGDPAVPALAGESAGCFLLPGG